MAFSFANYYGKHWDAVIRGLGIGTLLGGVLGNSMISIATYITHRHILQLNDGPWYGTELSVKVGLAALATGLALLATKTVIDKLNPNRSLESFV